MTVNKVRVLNIAVILVPLICLLGATASIAYQVHRIMTLQDRRQKIEGDIAIVESRLRELQMTPRPSRIPTVEQTPQEQSGFLNSLRAYAELSRVRLARWTNATPLAPPAGARDGSNPQSNIPEGVTPISSAVEVIGPYSGVREFLYNILRSPRLLTMTDVRWGRTDRWPTTGVSFTLTRYVTPPGKTPLAASPTDGSARGLPLETASRLRARPLYPLSQPGKAGPDTTGSGQP